MFASFLKKLFSRRRSPHSESSFLYLEPLEDRFLPSTLTWHFRGGNPTNWTVVNNWDVAPNQPATEYPGQNRNTDTAQFDGTSVDTCTLNTSVTLSGIIITSGYTGKISFLQGKS